MLDEATIEKLKLSHGHHLALVTTSTGAELVFRKPKRQEYNAWYDKAQSDPSAAAYSLALQCIVHPGQEALTLALDSQPALLQQPNGVLDAITDLAGLGVKENAPQKKLL